MKLTEGQRLVVVREQLGFQAVEFAKLIGIHKESYKAIERGSTKVSAKLLRSICEKYDISADYILYGIGEPFYDEVTRQREHPDFVLNKEWDSQDVDFLDNNKDALIKKLDELEELSGSLMSHNQFLIKERNDLKVEIQNSQSSNRLKASNE